MSEQIPSRGPPFWGREAELHRVLEKVLKNCNVKEGDKVILFTDTRKDLGIVRAFFSAALNLDLDVQILLTTPLAVRGDPPKNVVDFLKSADLIVNLLTMEWLYQKSHREVLNAGSRVLLGVECTE